MYIHMLRWCSQHTGSQFIQLNCNSEEKSLASSLLQLLEASTHSLIASSSLDKYACALMNVFFCKILSLREG